MKILDITLYSYKLELSKPLFVKGHELKQREGVIIIIESDENISGIGEIAPLPFYSQESLDEAKTQILQIKNSLIGFEISENMYKLDGQFEKWLKPYNLFPSVQFAIEMGICQLLSNFHKIPLQKLIAQESHDHIFVHGFLQGSTQEVVSQAKELIGQGYKSLKLKIGQNLKEDIEKITALNEAIEGKALVHLDANQAYSYEEACQLAKAIGCAGTDYIEEPFADLSRIPDFFMETLIPVALDESLSSSQFSEIKSLEGLDFIVVKPTTIGGLEKSWQIINHAKKLAISAIISSTFESSVGILTLAQLAGSFTRDASSAGLDTLKYFKNNLLKEHLHIENGKIDISGKHFIEKKDLETKYLTAL